MNVSALWFFLMMPWVGLQCVIVAFPGHTYLLCICTIGVLQRDSTVLQFSIKNCKLFFCVSLKYEMSRKLHLTCMKTFGLHAKIRCNLKDISYLSETQKSSFQIL